MTAWAVSRVFCCSGFAVELRSIQLFQQNSLYANMCFPRVRNGLAHQIHGDLWSSANTTTEGKGHCKQSPCVTPFIRYRMHEHTLDRLRKLLRWNTCEWLLWWYQSGLGHQHLPSTVTYSHGMEMNAKPEETLHFIAGDNISSISRLRSLTFLRMAVFIPFSVASDG